MTTAAAPERDTAGLLRAGMIALAGLSIAGTAVELATLRHWNGALQLPPWAALGVLTAVTVVLATRPGRIALRAVRIGAVTILPVSGFGIVQHVEANYDTAPLDRDYSGRWDAMPEIERWWAAASGAVGPAPSLAAGAMAQAALLLLLATVRHPSLSRERPADRGAERAG